METKFNAQLKCICLERVNLCFIQTLLHTVSLCVTWGQFALRSPDQREVTLKRSCPTLRSPSNRADPITGSLSPQRRLWGVLS